MWISRREYERLVGEVDFWRERADREQKRADDAVDQALLEAGRAPLATPEQHQVKAEMSAAAKEMLDNLDMYTDGDDSEVVDEEGFMKLAPEAVQALAGLGK